MRVQKLIRVSDIRFVFRRFVFVIIDMRGYHVKYNN